MVDVNESRQLLTAGDDFGTVFVYRYPVLKNSQQALRLTGHSEHIPSVKFVNGGEYIISAGGMDRCYFQWKRQ